MLTLVPLVVQIVPDMARWLFGGDAARTMAAVAEVVRAVTGADVSTEAGAAAALAVLAGKPELATGLQVGIARIAAANEHDRREADAARLAAALAGMGGPAGTAHPAGEGGTAPGGALLPVSRVEVSHAAVSHVDVSGADVPPAVVRWAPVVVSAVVLATFGLVMVLALTRALPPGSETVLSMLLGTLAAMATSVVSYWVGSSSGSARKTDLLFRSAPPPTG